MISGAETYINYNGDGSAILAAQLPVSFDLLEGMVGTGVSLKAYDSNADHPATATALSNSMDISGTISITSQPAPADDTAKSVGDSISIGWGAVGNITKFDVFYSIDGGSDVKINATTLTTSPYAFSILPAMVGNNVRLKTKDADLTHPAISSSASNSMDVSGTIAITAQPAGAGDTLTIGGASPTIEWSTGTGVTHFDVVYKIGSGSENAVSGCSNTAASSCTFALASGMVGKNLTVIVKDADTATHPQVLSPPVSSVFNVKGALTITTQPVGANNTAKVVGDVVPMNWSANAASVSTYNLYYVISGAETYIDYKGGSAAITDADLPISLTLLPAMVGTGVSLKVYDANADHPTTVSALSNSMDISGAITLTTQPAPADDTAKDAGDAISIAWSGPSGIVKYDVFYSIDGGSDTLIAACNDILAATSSCTFSLMDTMVGKTVRLKVKDYDPAHPASVSAASNSMNISGTIAITSQPASAAELLTIGGANRTIEWSDVGLTNFDVVYKIGSGSENAVSGCSNLAANSCTFALASGMVGKSVTVIVKDADTTNHPQVASPPSSNAFDVKGALTITTQPAPGDNTPKVVGNQVSMNWSSNAASVNTYHLYYVLGGAETYINYNGDGSAIASNQLPISFNLLSDMVGTGVSLKAYDSNANHPTTATALSNSMDISGTLSITSQPAPADDTAKSAGDPLSIGWGTTGNITQYDLFYSIDGGSEVKINSSPITTSPYTFPTGILPEMVGQNVRLKLKDANMSNPVTASAASNSMDVSGTIAILAQPANANETLTIGGADRTIEWTDVGLTNFDVFYKIGSGSENAVSGCSNLAANSCTFALANAMVGKNLTVIVKDADTAIHPQVQSPLVSNVFNVKGALTITTQPAPGNNTAKLVGDQVSMNWSSNAASVNTYHLYYVIGGAETYINYNGDGTAIASNQLPITLTLLPDMVGTAVSLRAYDANTDHPSTVSALSNSMDISGAITLTTQPVPADDTAKSAGDAVSIAWSGPSGIVKYDVFYSINGGSDTLIAACNDVPSATASCTFGIVDTMVGKTVRLKVKDYDPAHPVSSSAASNSMNISGTIAITAQPASADETLTIGGANRTIEWSDVGLTNFDVVYKIGSGSENAVSGCSNIAANSCTFALASAMVGKSLTVIVKDADTTNHPQALSPPASNAFNVKAALTVTTQPVGADHTAKVVGDEISMNWSSNAASVNTYHLYYVIAGAETYINHNGDGSAIASSQLPISFNLLPEMTGTGVTLKAYDANADHPTTATALSNSMDISGTLAITSLTVDGQAVTSGQTFITGNTVVVGWNPSGITKFNVLYSIDGGADQLVNGTPIEGTNSHTFTAPAAMTGKNIVLKVKDADVSHPIVVSSPSSAFDMKGTIAITTQPVATAGTTLSVNDPVSIQWAYTGNIASFDVYYSINGGSDLKLNTSAINGTTYGFNVPDGMLGRNVVLKVKDANTSGHPATESSASTLFHVKGTITIDSFTIDGDAVTSGQTFASNDAVVIGWGVSGNITDINVFYKIGAGDDVKINSSPIVAPTTSYNFNALAAMVGKNVLLKVKDADLVNHAPNEVSSNLFDMKGILAFTTAPSGVITVDDEVPIAWSKNGNMPEVHLYYTVGGADTLIASNLAVSSVDWTVPPEAIGATVTLKVKDANLSNPASQAVSTSFGIKGKLAVTKPDGLTAYEVSDTPPIEWTKSSTISSVDLYYSINGSDWTLITTTGPVTGTAYNTWNVPGAALSPNTYVKAKDANADHPLTEAVSADFPVRGRLVMNEPGSNPNTFFEVNGETEITWTPFGSTGPMAGAVTLWYTINGGSDNYPY
ncbi:MAG: hypothetical protein V2A56_01265 [bacterium]